ncbi:alpha/beta fold hydrolase [Paeniglutamicibacter sp. NPDC091659]|uniref:alpha/beta fold hydrolase n=1 Tax=Paeniglutamicibacter sp. NPDC091659 TaxID=3364389 RepID=UPI0038156391
MSRHHEPAAGGAGADEEFIDQAPETPAPVDGGAEPKPDSKAKTSGEKESAGSPAPEKPEPAKAAVDTSATAKGAVKEKPVRPPKAPKSAKPPTKPAVAPAAAKAESAAATVVEPASPAENLPRDPGGYPEFHAPTRARRDGKAAQTIVFLHGGNVANWSWDPQVRAFSDYEVLTPHLPGFGARADEDWAGLDSAADDVAAVIADEVSNGGAHLVGLSLGGAIALRVAARHPELVESLMISGVPAAGVSASMRAMSRMQLKLFSSEWYWRFQAGAYGMVADEKELFADHGTKLRTDNMRAIMDEVDPGGLPDKLGDYKGPALVIAGSKEPKLVAKSFPVLERALPQAQFRTAAGRHHQWNIEDPILFNATVRSWVEKGIAHPRLQVPSS